MLRHKVNPKVAIPATGAALVGMQAANGLMDAQSAGYFTGELREMRQKKKAKQMARSNVAKANRIFDAEADRNRRLGVYEGAALGATAAGAGFTVQGGRKIGLKGVKTDLARIPKKRMKGYQRLGLGLAATAASASAAAGIHRRSTSERNRPWT